MPELRIKGTEDPETIQIVDDQGHQLHEGPVEEVLLVMKGANWALRRGIHEGAMQRERDLGIQSGT